MASAFSIGKEFLRLDEIVDILKPDAQVSISGGARRAIVSCREYLEDRIASGDELFYGINTGFGSQYNVRIPTDQINRLQHNLILSHAAGTGGLIDEEVSRAMLILKVISLSKAHSAVRLELVEQLVAFINAGLHPTVFKLGSLGASGDLAPLAHMSLPLLGLGSFYSGTGTIPASKGLRQAGLEPLLLQAKEGIALINGTQFSTAHGLLAWKDASQLLTAANLVTALSLEAFSCNLSPFSPLIQEIRGHRGQVEVAQEILNIIGDRNGTEVQLQDPYAFRCVPQVHGATWDVLAHAGKVLETEMNAVTDNPIVFPDENQIISGGNFHAQPIALLLDHMAVAISELANISERRTYQLLSGTRGLTPCLIPDPGFQSGLMIAQYTAASIVNRNKILCYPASADSIPSSMGQEDHVSMAANSGTKLREIVMNSQLVLGIELICAFQAIELLGKRESLSSKLQETMTQYREYVPFIEEDVIISDLIDKSVEFLRTI